MIFTADLNLLVDSDYLVGAFRVGDPHQEESTKGLERAGRKNCRLSVLNLVLQETTTVLSHRVNMNAVRLFWENHGKLRLNIILVEPELEALAWKVFLKQTKKGTSFVDCANLAAIEKFHLDGILSFDKFYPKKLLIG